MSGSSMNFQSPNGGAPGERMPKLGLVASSSGAVTPKVLKRMVPRRPLKLGSGQASEIAMFLLKVAALEAVRRLSRARCPFVWRAVQALQFLSYAPLKWIQRWYPLKIIVKGVQNFSRPLLFLSIATAFSDHSEDRESTIDDVNDSQPDSESSNEPSSSELRSCDDNAKNVTTESWLAQLDGELKKQGVSLPERISEDELRRFYNAANGDISCLVSSLKRTIRWRETYYILSSQELEAWSHLVFWHGVDIMHRPCLIVRLGLACCSLRPHDRPRFAQALVSQVEYGVQHLINEADPTITVIMDGEGLTPMRFPMQMLRSFSTLMQNHYPNRLGALFIVRLPPVVRVIAQTFIQVLKPSTRKKLRIEGDTYHKVLSEFLETVPAVLDGKCKCSKCRMILAGYTWESRAEEIIGRGTVENASDDESTSNAYAIDQLPSSGNYDHILRSALVVILMLLIAIAFLGGIYDLDSLSSLPL